MSSLTAYFQSVQDVASRVPTERVSGVVTLLRRAWKNGNLVMLCGNGGSASTASHLATDFAKGTTIPDRPPLRVVSLADNVALMTAWANDTEYSRVFAEQVANIAGNGDVLIAISASGNSPNVLAAVEAARQRGATTVGITGFSGGRLGEIVDHAVVVPVDDMQLVEDAHLWIGHAIFRELRDGPFPE